MPRTLISTTTTSSGGEYTLSVSPNVLRSIAVSGGFANLEVDADSDARFFTSQASNPAVSSVQLGGMTPSVCTPWKLQKELSPSWAVVGQAYVLSNATHVQQSFVYSNGQSSTLGVGISPTGKVGSFTGSGAETTSTTATQDFPSSGSPGYIWYRTLFKVGLYHAACGTPGRIADASSSSKYLVRSDGWAGGTNIEHPKTAPTAEFCSPELAGAVFITANERAVTWSAGFTIPVVGFNAQAQTGYDTSAQLTFNFGADRQLCGTNDSPPSAAQLVAKKLASSMRPTKLLFCLLLLAAAILGCSAAPSAGPLGPPGNGDTECMPANVGQTDTEGLQSFTNSGHDTLVIARVGLASARNIRLAGAYIVNIGSGTELVGAWRGFPPAAGQLASDVALAKWQPVSGAKILPGETINVVVGLAPTSHAAASTAGVEIFYHDGGSQYELVSKLAVTIKVSPAKCF